MLLSSEGRYCNGCVALHTLSSSPHKTTHFPIPTKEYAKESIRSSAHRHYHHPLYSTNLQEVHTNVLLSSEGLNCIGCVASAPLSSSPLNATIFIVSTYGSQGMIRSSPHQHYHRPPSSIYPYEVYTNVFLSPEGLNLNGFVEAKGRVNIKDTSTFHVPNGW